MEGTDETPLEHEFPTDCCFDRTTKRNGDSNATRQRIYPKEKSVLPSSHRGFGCVMNGWFRHSSTCFRTPCRLTGSIHNRCHPRPRAIPRWDQPTFHVSYFVQDSFIFHGVLLPLDFWIVSREDQKGSCWSRIQYDFIAAHSKEECVVEGGGSRESMA